MNKRELDKIKKKIQKLEKILGDFNDKINKELEELNNIIGSENNGIIKTVRRKTPRAVKESDDIGDG